MQPLNIAELQLPIKDRSAEREMRKATVFMTRLADFRTISWPEFPDRRRVAAAVNPNRFLANWAGQSMDHRDWTPTLLWPRGNSTSNVYRRPLDLNPNRSLSWSCSLSLKIAVLVRSSFWSRLLCYFFASSNLHFYRFASFSPLFRGFDGDIKGVLLV